MSETVAAIAESAATAENETEKDDSMEKLLVDEEDVKNNSSTADDFLGGKSLLMSDSDREEEEQHDKIKGKKTSPKNKMQRLSEQIQAEVTEETAKTLENKAEVLSNSGEDKEPQASAKMKMSVVIGSESEEDTMATKSSATILTDHKKISLRNKKKRLLDSDEEQEDMESAPAETAGKEQESSNKAENDITTKTKKIFSITDTDSEEETLPYRSPKVNIQHDTPKGKAKKIFTRKKTLLLESDDSEEEKAGNEEQSEILSKLKRSVDSESECSTADESEDNKEFEEGMDASSTVDTSEKTKKDKIVRASAKKALDTMQAIQSEQQRLQREAHITIPYHQPKPRTLQEFLNRRTINRPLATALAGGSPMPVKQPRQSLGLRMNKEELEAYAKLMEDRAKEATEFYKSESEDDKSGELNENPGFIDKGTEEGGLTFEQPAEQDRSKKYITADGEQTDSNTEEMGHLGDAAALESPQFKDIETAKETVLPKTHFLITEVVELPKLDLSALNISPPSKPATPRVSEAIRQLKMEKATDKSPSLEGDSNMVIDLETGDMFAKKPTGVDNLLKRLMKTREPKKSKTMETVNILSAAHGKLELSKVNIHLHEEEPVKKDQKPGAAYIKVQQQLKSLIKQKRMEDLKKKQAEEIEHNKCLGDEFEEEEDYMDLDEEENEPDEKPGKNELKINEEEEIEEEQSQLTDKSDEEEEDSNNSDEAEGISEGDEQSGPESEQPESIRKNRIIHAFQEDNSDDELDLLQTPMPPNITTIPATQLQSTEHKLFDMEAQRTASDEENELLGLCSGKFTQTQKPAELAAAVISQIPFTQAKIGEDASAELEALCSGNFETQAATLEPICKKILSSDEEKLAREHVEEEKPRNKKLTKKMKKKAKLGFSDDEESEDDIEDDKECLNEEDVAEESDAEVPETFIDYDSDENEIIVEMTKKDRKLRAANFLEKEAELSESEWGSADEDEKNLDTYDVELGDEEEFDREKLKRELEQIHARKMLDQDIREVRQIKEMLFEEDDGAVRQRQFRWKNAESGFSLEEQGNTNEAEANDGSGDEENEHLWRKIRYEREQLLLEKGLKADSNASSVLPLSPAIVNTSSVRKLHIITTKKSTVESKKSAPFLISKSVNDMQQQKKVRGSFLVRDKVTLNKIAGLTKGDADGAAGTVSVNTSKAKNFVFATLTEEEHEHQKRKAADLLNSSNETGINFMKKPRLEPRRDKCLIDQLL